MSIYNNSTNYSPSSAHLCDCAYCPKPSLSPTSSTYLPITPRISTTNFSNINFNNSASYPSWNIPVKQPNRWESVAPRNTLRHTTASQGEDPCVNLPQTPTNLLELSEEDVKFYSNSSLLESEPSASTSNGMLQNPISHLSFPNESFKHHAAEVANVYKYDASISQSSFNNDQFYGPQSPMSLSNGSYPNQINDGFYSDASFRNPTVDAHTLYYTAPPHPRFAVQPLSPTYLTVEQRGFAQPSTEHYSLPQTSTEHLQTSPASWYPVDLYSKKQKHRADAGDDIRDTTEQEVNLHYQKKVEDKKLGLGPNITGKKIPHSECVGQQDANRTTKGPSPPKLSKGKSATRDATGKQKRGPNKPKATKSQETQKAEIGDGPGTSLEGERSPKRARTNKNGPPTLSNPQTSGSTDGGRLVDATATRDIKMERKSYSKHALKSQTGGGPKRSVFFYEPKFGGNLPDNMFSTAGGSMK